MMPSKIIFQASAQANLKSYEFSLASRKIQRMARPAYIGNRRKRENLSSKATPRHIPATAVRFKVGRRRNLKKLARPIKNPKAAARSVVTYLEWARNVGEKAYKKRTMNPTRSP